MTESVYEQLAVLVPSVRELVTFPAFEPAPPGALVDPAWLASRIDDTAARWGCSDTRTAATLWWYSASSVILGPFGAALLVTGSAVDPDTTALQAWLRPYGYLLATRAAGQLPPGPAPAGAGLAAGFERTVKLLADLGGASPRALWAIAADSLASCMLRAGRELGDVDHACRLAVAVAEHCPALPTPRWVDLKTRRGEERFVRRGSCCLLYQAREQNKCLSCPRRSPADRRAAMGA